MRGDPVLAPKEIMYETPGSRSWNCSQAPSSIETVSLQAFAQRLWTQQWV